MEIRVIEYDVLLDVPFERRDHCQIGISCFDCYHQYLTCHGASTPCGVRRWTSRYAYVTPKLDSDLPF